MAAMPDDLIELLKEWHPVPRTNVGGDGTPNVAARSVMVRDPETNVWGELYFRRTCENRRHNQVASLPARRTTPPYTAYRVNGRVTIHEHNQVVTGLDRRVRAGHGAE